MFNFTPSQRKALIFFSCLLAVLLVAAGSLRLIKGGRLLHILFIQPTPMQPPSAEASQPQALPPANAILSLPPHTISPARPPARLRTPVNINAAPTNQLQAVPGIGPALASEIARYRAVHGPFQMAEDLLKVKGIGPKTLEEIRPHITCGTG